MRFCASIFSNILHIFVIGANPFRCRGGCKVVVVPRAVTVTVRILYSCMYAYNS